MNSTVVTTPLASLETPLLAVIVPSGNALSPALTDLDRATGGTLGRAISTGDYKGKKDETALFYGTGPAQRVLLVGAGKAGEVTRSSLRRAAAVAGKRARGVGVPRFAIAVTPEARSNVPARDLGQVLAEGAAHGSWAFTEMKKPPEEPRVEVDSVAIVANAAEQKDVEAGRVVGAAIAEGARFTRWLQMLPGNKCTPSFLAEQAREVAKKHGHIVTTLDLAAIKREGMGALLAVAQGSAEEPRFIVLEYQGGAKGAAPVVLVGKGVTFDSGGISIKPAANMEEMKYDMSGAAAVLGTFVALGRLKPAINVVGVIPATENLPSGTAVKPGDVVTSYSGKTIEIINTDAEGRLILCDALWFVKRLKPAAVIDAATLTGAVTVALGNQATGLMGNDDALMTEVQAAGERAGERCWPFPLWEEYHDLLKSEIADVKNSGGRGAGTIAGGWFLKEFVDGYPWVHLDIAGTAYSDGEGPHQTKGPTGMGVRLFSEFVLRRAGA
ncbi:MAG TPA: leucyl aminopeptidase [Gemmatimonadales bacterium]|nr:leucyl aminopeptidase [Gemmatimonadales bacterium]